MKADRRPFFMVSEKSKENLSAQIAPAPQESLLGGEEPLIRHVFLDDALPDDEHVFRVQPNYLLCLLQRFDLDEGIDGEVGEDLDRNRHGVLVSVIDDRVQESNWA